MPVSTPKDGDIYYYCGDYVLLVVDDSLSNPLLKNIIINPNGSFSEGAVAGESLIEALSKRKPVASLKNLYMFLRHSGIPSEEIE
jgi:hypothetical protein